MANDRWMWDATATLEALGAAEVALWVWEPEKDRLRLTGSTRALGLGPLAPDCSSAALRALALPQDRATAEDILRVQPPGGEVAVRLSMRNGTPCIWRGVWLEEGVRCAGVVAAEVRFAASGIDHLTGLADRKSFITLARERLQQPGEHELIVADLDRLRRLNEALGHERADLVLAALGSRLSAAFPPGALLARIGEDEFAALAPVGISPGGKAAERRCAVRWNSRCASPASTSTRPSASAPSRPPAARTPRKPPNCCAAPSSPWRPPSPTAAAAPPPMAAAWKATASRAWPSRAT